MAHPWRTARSPRSSSIPRLPDTDTTLPPWGQPRPQAIIRCWGFPATRCQAQCPPGHLSTPCHLSQHQEGVALCSPQVRLLDQGSRGGGRASGQALWRQSLRTGDRAVLTWARARAHGPAAQGACPRRLTAVRGGRSPRFFTAHCNAFAIPISLLGASLGGAAPRAVGPRPCVPFVPVRLSGHGPHLSRARGLPSPACRAFSLPGCRLEFYARGIQCGDGPCRTGLALAR